MTKETGDKTMTTNLQNAINKARRIKCAVKVIGSRAYVVITPQAHRYVVRFEMLNGLRYGNCNCKAGVAGLACYHLAKSAFVDNALQQMRAH
jgi:hypothetical protein